MSLINRVLGFSTKDVCLVELLMYYEQKNVDVHMTKFYYRPIKAFRVAREKHSGKGVYYKDLIGHKKYKDLKRFDNYVGDVVATKTADLDGKKRISYRIVETFNDKDNYHELDNTSLIKRG